MTKSLSGTRRVVVTGMGVVCPLGLNVTEFGENLMAGKSGVDLISRFDTTDYPTKVAAEVKNFVPTDYMDPKTIVRTSRAVQLAVAAAKEAIASAGLDMSRETPERVGVVASSMVENQYVGEQWVVLKQRGPRRIDPLLSTKARPSRVSLQLGMLLGAKGVNLTLDCLCASGAGVIAACYEFILLGRADVMIAAPSDASLDELSLAAIGILGALSKQEDPSKASRPFDLNRDGFVYGEGAGVMVLESLEHARKRSAPILAELAGVGWSFDAYDFTAPQPATEAMAMRSAISNAGLVPEDVDYINAHGTSTKLNDASETKAIKMVFGERAYQIPISAHKSMFGHLINAAGCVEAIGAILTMKNGVIPPTINYETPDPECDLDYVPNVARSAEVNVCLKNGFGLGGQNCCLVFRKFGS